MRNDASPLLDKSIMRLSFGEDRSFIGATMQIYMRDAPILAQKAYDALMAGNNADLASHAHALKGITGYFTKGELYTSCLDLEKLGRESELPLQAVHALGIWSTINNYLGDMLQAMQDYLEESGTS